MASPSSTCLPAAARGIQRRCWDPPRSAAVPAEVHCGDLVTVDHPALGRDAHTEHLSGIVEGHQRFTLERRIHATSVYESKALSSDVKSGFRAQDAAKRVPDAGPHIGRNWAFSSIFERLIWFFSRLTRGIAGWRPLSGFSTLPPCFLDRKSTRLNSSH